MTFKQFQKTGVIIPWHLHCMMFGVDTEHEDINQRVISYFDGYHIHVHYKKDGSISYEAIYGNISYESPDRILVEKKLWNDFIVHELNANVVSEIQEELQEAIGPVFSDFLTKYKCSGDITPEQTRILEASTNTIATVLNEMINQNK